jgi:outer membrane protein OmpA-like peptidoglycan-associated protein
MKKTAVAILAAAAASALPSPASAQSRDAAGLGCAEEVARLVETIRSGDAWPRVRAEIEPILDTAAAAAERGEEGNCYASLADARARAAQEGVVLEGLAAFAEAGPAGRERLVVELAAPEIYVSVPGQRVTVDARTGEIEQEQVGRLDVDIRRGAASLTRLPAVETAPVLVRDVEFGFDAAQVDEDARATLREIVEALENAPDPTILLTGYTSAVGDPEYNAELAERRVEAVASALADLGVPEDAVRTRALGEENPEGEADPDERAQENRRVEIRVLPGG